MSLGRWFSSDYEGLLGPAERRPLPPSVQQIRIDDDAIWQDLCDENEWKPLGESLQRLVGAVRSPETIEVYAASSEWNLLFFSIVFEVERLHYLLLARQLNERIQDLTYDDPLPSLLHGLDVAVASALETGRQLNVEMSDPGPEPPSQSDADDEELPEWGRGYAFVLYRRFVAEVQSVIELLPALCKSAYEDEE
jgi:hypothetical protein